ncbi:MAG: hypothetical protein U0175_18800 [Caldilineaceae bacterium]
MTTQNSATPEPSTTTTPPPAPKPDIGIDIPFPATESRQLEIGVGACKLKVSPGGAEPWVTGTYHDPRNALPLQVDTKGNVARISQQFSGSEWWSIFGNQLPSFDLRLGKAYSYTLTVETGASDCALELGGLPLSALKIRQGAGKFAVDFSMPNPQRLTKFSVEGGAASLEMNRLGDANFAELSVAGGAAGYKLNFDGKLQENATVRVNAGASSVEIEVPAATAARIISETTIGSINVGDGFTKQQGAFCTQAALAGGTPLLTIHVTVALGSIQLRII